MFYCELTSHLIIQFKLNQSQKFDLFYFLHTVTGQLTKLYVTFGWLSTDCIQAMMGNEHDI